MVESCAATGVFWVLQMDIMYHSFVSTEKCVEATGLNKYEVAVLVAKRAKELASGAPPVVDKGSKKVLTVALEEMVSPGFNIEELSERLMVDLETNARERASKERPGSNDLEMFRKNVMRAASSDHDKFDPENRLASEFDREFGGVIKSSEDISSVSYSDEEIDEKE